VAGILFVVGIVAEAAGMEVGQAEDRVEPVVAMVSLRTHSLRVEEAPKTHTVAGSVGEHRILCRKAYLEAGSEACHMAGFEAGRQAVEVHQEEVVAAEVVLKLSC